MQILLHILAVIGIILLCIIGLIVMVLGLVLFVPIRYRLYAKKESHFLAKLKITWLLHFVTVGYEYPEPKELVIRIFGFKINLDKQEDTQKETGKETEKELDDKTEETDKTKEIEKIEEKEEIEKINEEPEKAHPPESANTAEPKKKVSKEGSFQKIQFKIWEIYAKIKEVISDVRYYWDILQKKENRLLLERIKRWLLKIFKSIRPRVIVADTVIGTGAPDTTGYLLAIYGMLSPLYGYQIQITPDFEQKIFEGTVLIKGRITIFVLLYFGLRIYFDKQMQKLIGIIKERDRKNGRKSI